MTSEGLRSKTRTTSWTRRHGSVAPRMTNPQPRSTPLDWRPYC